MPRKFIAGLVIGSVCTVTAAYFSYFNTNDFNGASKLHAYISPNQKINPHLHPKINISENAKWTTVADIEASLADMPPMNVGFDIDDTVLFPHAAFHTSYQKFCPFDQEPLRPSCVNQQGFWDHVNAQGQLNPPKEVGKQLIEMHKRRGDTIFFITAREKSKYIKENMSDTLRDIFKIEDMPDVIYLGMATINTDKPGKTPAIIENDIKVFYGDSDADIAAAKAANIRGIRILRAPNSQDNHIMPLNGRYGEEVIIGSDV
jgi:acid phosphatase (class B)